MGNPLLGNLILPEKGDLCPHCGKQDTHIGYVCPQIGAVEFDGFSGVKRIEYRSFPYQPFGYPQASGMPGAYPWAGAPIPCYTPNNPRPRYEVGAVGVCGGVPDSTFIPIAGWTAGKVNSI